jgi:hypothetical protein
MSDAQEAMAVGAIETARQTLNRAKWVLAEYMSDQFVKPRAEISGSLECDRCGVSIKPQARFTPLPPVPPAMPETIL